MAQRPICYSSQIQAPTRGPFLSARPMVQSKLLETSTWCPISDVRGEHSFHIEVGSFTSPRKSSSYCRRTESMLKSSAAPPVSSSQNLLVPSKSTMTEMELLSIFSRRSGAIPFSFSNGAKASSTPGSYSMRGVVSWKRSSKELTLTVSKLQYVPPTRSPRLLPVIPLKDGLLIVVGPQEALDAGLASGTESRTSANDCERSTLTVSTSENASETGTRPTRSSS